jgi:hypothetical protein
VKTATDSIAGAVLIMTRSLLLIATVSWGGFSSAALADDGLPGKPPTKEQYERAAEGVKLLLQENRKFDSGHKLKGQVADAAVRQMLDEGYGCGIGYLDLPELEKNGLTPRIVRTPMIFCTLASSQTDDVCSERRVTLTIAWKDAKAAEPELRSQLAASLITDRAFRCVPAGWVLR